MKKKKNPDDKIAISLRIDPAQLATLQARSEETLAPVAALIRRAIDEFIKRGM